MNRSLGDTFRSILGVAAVGSLAGLLVVIGVVLLTVGNVRRSRAKRPLPAAAAWPSATAAPGWYPDPQGSGRRRWWDGTQWPDHQA